MCIKWVIGLVYIRGCIISQLLSGDLGKPIATWFRKLSMSKPKGSMMPS